MHKNAEKRIHIEKNVLRWTKLIIRKVGEYNENRKKTGTHIII